MNKMRKEIKKSMEEDIKPIIDIANKFARSFGELEMNKGDVDVSRKIKFGDRVINQDNGTIGRVIGFYKETPFIENAVVLTDDGCNCEAPTSSWAKTILNKKFGMGVK